MNRKMTKWLCAALAVVMVLAGALSSLPVRAEEPAGNRYLQLKVEFPEDATGNNAYYPIRFWMPKTIDFETGDKLVYDVYMSERGGGFGGIELCIDELNLRDQQLTDGEGIGVHPTADLSDKAHLKWYTRQIPIPANFVETDFSQRNNGPAVIFPVDMPYDASVLAGKTMLVKYDNIRIVNAAGETKHTIFSGDEPTVEGFLIDSLNGVPGVSYTISVEEEQPAPSETEPSETTPSEQEPVVPGDALKPDSKYLELDVAFPEDLADSVQAKDYYRLAFQVPETVTLAKGDKLIYDVWMSRNAGGFGQIAMISKDASANLHDSGAVDQNGVGVHPARDDVSQKAALQWYNRVITLPDSFEGKAVNVFLPVVLPYLPSVLKGETVQVRYDNIRIAAADGSTKYMIFDSDQQIEDGYFADLKGIDGVTYTLTGPTATEPEQPTDPEQPTNPEQPTGPSESTPQPSESEAPAETVKPTQPAKQEAYLELKVTFPKDASGTGHPYYPILFWMPNTIDFAAGDKLVYDVWMSRNAGGFGGVDLCIDELNLRDSGAKDQNDIPAHPTGDVSLKAAEQWYTRTILLPDSFAQASFTSKPTGPAVIFPVDMPYDASLLAGETVVVRYDNVRIVDASGATKYTVFTGNEETVFGYLYPQLNGFENVNYDIQVVRTAPSTGDAMFWQLPVVLAVVSAAGIVTLTVRRKRHG